MSHFAVTLTKGAERDFINLARFKAGETELAAHRFENELWVALYRLSESPKLGQTVNGFRDKIFAMRVSARFKRYLIVYRVLQAARIEVVALVHATRDIRALFPAASVQPARALSPIAAMKLGLPKAAPDAASSALEFGALGVAAQI